jgi:DNA adenine methylase
MMASRQKSVTSAGTRLLIVGLALCIYTDHNRLWGLGMKTPIRWAGSKKALVPVLKKHWDRNPDARYIEPFCGSACLFFELEPREAVLGDLNWELITTYRAIRASSSRIIECMKRFPITKAHYYRLRELDPASLSDVEVAARFLFLNKLCFNGIYRTNLAGRFNVPYAKPKRRRVVFDFETLHETASLLKNASLSHGDFEIVLDEARVGDFVYLDPPYAVAKRRVFAEYHAKSFSECDLDRLRLLDVMRYVYGAIAFIGVVTLVFASLVALERVLG